MYYIRSLIYDLLYWCPYGIVLEALRSVLETLRCVLVTCESFFFYVLNTGAVIRPKTTQNRYDSTDILLEDVKRLIISMRDRFV